MAEGYLPRLSNRLMNESLLATAAGPEYGVRQRLDPPQSMFMEMAQPDRGMSFLDRFKSVGTPQGGMELAANLIGGPSLRGIRAFHGSPHKFDKFDMSRIGTGEGAQAYGHGLYFAESEPVARSYSKMTVGQTPSNDIVESQVQKFNQYAPRGLTQGDRDFALQVIEERQGLFGGDDLLTVANALRGETTFPVKNFNAVRDALAKIDANPGHMYEVNIRANPEQFLDWDQKVRDMAPRIQGKLSDFGFNINGPDQGLLGSQIVTRGMDGGAAEASRKFRDAGIPGIKYLDQGSRNFASFERDVASIRRNLTDGEAYLSSVKDPTERARINDTLATWRSQLADIEKNRPTSNYVVFDDSIIDILKRYGLAGGGLTPLVAASQGDWSYAQ